MSNGTIVSILKTIRQPIANYQESKGVPKSKSYGFVDATKHMSNAVITSIRFSYNMLYSSVSMLELSLYLIRFILDTFIEIYEEENNEEKCILLLVFILKMLIIIYIIIYITRYLLIPQWDFFYNIVEKIFRLIFLRE